MTILSSLKGLLKKMGGTSAAEANTISEVIGEITSAYQNGGGGGGGDVLVAKGEYDEVTDATTLDKTWQEIFDGGFTVIDNSDATAKAYQFASEVFEESGTYTVEDYVGKKYTTNSANGYPTDAANPK